ncbi:MAG: AAA family ATPase, partial [Planctomycetota bacterium]
MNTEVLIILFFGVIMTSLAVYAATRGKAAPEEKPAESPSPDTKAPTAQDLGAIAEKLESRLENLAHPGDCLQDEDFEKAAAALASDAYTIVQVRNYAMGSNWVLQCIGLEALRRREDSAAILDRTRSRLKNLWAWPLYFAIRFLDEKSDEPEIGNMLTGAQYWWADNAMLCEELGTLFEKRLKAGEEVILGKSFSAADDETRGNIDKFVAALQDRVRQPIQAAIKARSKDSIDRNFLRSSGEILSRDQLRDPVFVTKQISRLKEELIAELTGGRPKSILVVGDSGVGKSALRRLLANELLDAGWHVFKTSATNIIADKVYVGQIEGQVQKLARHASVAKRVAIYVDRLNELDEFGRHSRKDTSILDQLWPMIENQEMFFVSETTPSGLQAMLKRYPSLPTSLKIVKMEPATEAATAEMAGSLLDLVDVELSESRKDEVVAEALQLSQQYLSHKSLPGSVLTLVELSVVRSQRSDDDEPLNRVHVLGALSQISGLPKDVLDERQKLDVDAVRQAFTKRIIGQDEAVECLVERIAMLKAGLTDPSRPVGVFLFAG